MALIFSTRRHRTVPDGSDVARRVAAPLSVRDILGPDGTAKAARAAARDRAVRDDRALGDALRHRLGLPQDTLARVEAGMVGTSVINPAKTPAAARRRFLYSPKKRSSTSITKTSTCFVDSCRTGPKSVPAV